MTEEIQEEEHGRQKRGKVEYRIFDTAVRIQDRARGPDDGPCVHGHAAVFDRESEDLGGFVEIIEPGFFRKAIKKSDTAALWNHNSDIILGRKSAKTLTLEEDDDGLSYTIYPPSWAKGHLETIERGDVTQSSFAFTVNPKGEKWEDKDGVRVRRLVSGGCDELLDVSPVIYPAYPDTDVKVRMSQDDIERIKGVVHDEVNRLLPQPSEGLGCQGVSVDGPGRVDSLDVKRKRLATY